MPAALLAVALGAASGTLRAQPDDAPEDWPCVQRFVPEVAAATLWPAPFEPALVDTWREDADIRALARYLGELEAVDEAALAAIDRYAGAVPEPARRDALTRVADGTVAVANERRARYLDGIRRYTRQQIDIAAQIEGTLNRLADIEDAEAANAGTPDSASANALPTAEERAAIDETLAWHERLYDQRERSIRALCERPVALEETLSTVLRELSYRLPDA